MKNFANYYDGRWSSASTDYPLGEAKNRSSATVYDGSYMEKSLFDSWTHVIASVMSSAGYSANGEDDVVGDSQFFRALRLLASGGLSYCTDGGTTDSFVLTPFYGETPDLMTGMKLSFFAANSSSEGASVTVGGGTSYPMVTTDGDDVTTQISAGDYVEIVFKGSDNEWILVNK